MTEIKAKAKPLTSTMASNIMNWAGKEKKRSDCDFLLASAFTSTSVLKGLYLLILL